MKYGIPNACNMCHDDQTDQWSLDAVREWYGPETYETTHFAGAFIAGQRGMDEAESALTAIAQDDAQPEMVRATALELLYGYGDAALRALVAAAKDESPLLRTTACRGLDRLPIEVRVAIVAPLLEDPVRSVRIEAAHLLASATDAMLNRDQRRALRRATDEYVALHHANEDTPDANFNLGNLYAAQERPGLAIPAYERAIRIDPTFLPSWVNLGNLYNRLGRNEEAEKVFREAIERAPGNGDLYYSLGLLLAEEERLDEAAGLLGRTAELMPDRPRVRYNYALALQHAGRRSQAFDNLLAAHQLALEEWDFLDALIIFHVQDEDWMSAEAYARAGVERFPGMEAPKQRLAYIVEQQR